jgi:hypothetical protein
MKKKILYFSIAILTCFCAPRTIFRSGAETLGIGVITNTNTRASESFKLYRILSSVDVRNGNNKKMDVIFADNPSVSTYYISGEVSHSHKTYADERLPYGIVVIDNRKSSSYRSEGYMTVFKLQLWSHGKFAQDFVDSTLYIPSNEESEQEPIRFSYYDEFYDESYKLYSPLLLDLFKLYRSLWSISIDNLKKSDILKFDVKAKGDGSAFHMVDFLPFKHSLNEKVPVSAASFNSYFENIYTTVERKELFFLSNYGSGDLNHMVALISYPKTSWLAATESYLQLGKRSVTEDIEMANMANWSALVLSNEIKDKVSNIYIQKKQALENILNYSKAKKYTTYIRLLDLNLALIVGFLRSGYCRDSDAHFDSLNKELSITFSSTQSTMNSLRSQNRFNKVISGITFGAALASAANDGVQGYNTTSETTNQMMKTHLETSRSMEAQMEGEVSAFRSYMNNLDLSVPISVIQPNGEDDINSLKPFLYLECLKLIYIDKKNEYWGNVYEQFCSSSPDMLKEFLTIKNKQLSDVNLKMISGSLLKYERYAYMKDKLGIQ